MYQDTGKLYVVATPIGNLEDLSLRAQRVLSHVTWVAAEDTRHSKGLLGHLGLATTLISYHEHNEQERTLILIQKLMQGEDGALICDAGTPLISDPGYLLVKKAHENGIPVIPVPGPCAAIAALSASGLATDKFLFEGFLPAKAAARRRRLIELVNYPHTLIFYESPHRLRSMLDDCMDIFLPARKACIAREITKKFESIHLNTLQNIVLQVKNGDIPVKGEFIMMIAGYEIKANPSSEADQEIERILKILLPEMSLKQAVSITTQLIGLSKNVIYDCATKLKNET